MKKFCITPPKSLKGETAPPGDKSISHRSVMLGSIAKGETRISNFLRSADCMSTIECFRKMGIEILEEGEIIKVGGKGLEGLKKPERSLDVGNSGTTIRLILGILAGQPFTVSISGDESIRRRPMGRVVDPLKKMGAKIRGRQKDNLAPLTITGGNLKAISYALPVASAQVKSSVLLAGLYASGTTTVIEKSLTRDHTERMLEHFGVSIKRENLSVSVPGGSALKAGEIAIPGDISSASYLLAAATLVPDSEIVIKNVGVNPGRTGIIDVLHRMGGDFEVINERIISNEPVADIVVRTSKLKGVELSGSIIPRIIDEIPVIAVLATQAGGHTVIKGASELRVKESDRIATMTTVLKRMGAKVKDLHDGFIIDGGAKLKGTKCISYKDHRVAMAISIGGLVAEGETIIEDVDCIETSFPGFAETLAKLSSQKFIEVK